MIRSILIYFHYFLQGKFKRENAIAKEKKCKFYFPTVIHFPQKMINIKKSCAAIGLLEKFWSWLRLSVKVDVIHYNINFKSINIGIVMSEEWCEFERVKTFLPSYLRYEECIKVEPHKVEHHNLS